MQYTFLLLFWGSFWFGDDDDINRRGCKIINEIYTETNELNDLSNKKNHTKWALLTKYSV